MRVFLALDLPDQVIAHLGEVAGELKATLPENAIRWVKPESIHLTLKFLGEVKPEFVDQVKEVVRPIAQETQQMQMSVGGFGVFPGPGRPRVLWIGVQEETGSLESLRDELEAAFEPFGFERERRSFTPHLTIGRVKRGANRREKEAIKERIKVVDVGKLAVFKSPNLTLFESELGPGGATYRVLHRFKFQGGET